MTQLLTQIGRKLTISHSHQVIALGDDDIGLVKIRFYFFQIKIPFFDFAKSVFNA